jgi:hypothetical protein
MKQLSLVVVAIVAVVVYGTSVVAFDARKAAAWVTKMGCSNASFTNCPGNRPCTDAEFYARALAAGGAIKLNPNDLSQWPYINYTGYNLCLGTGLYNILPTLGFTRMTPSTSYPVGAIVWTEMWYPGMPYFSFGDNVCDSHTPIVHGGPHCGMNCSFFNPRVAFAPPRNDSLGV